MAALTEYRAISQLGYEDLRASVMGLLSEISGLRSRGPSELRGAMETLLEQGLVSFEGDDSGYRQVLALYAGTLLRLGGANVQATLHEVRQRNDEQLERLAAAVVSRFGGTVPSQSSLAGRTDPRLEKTRHVAQMVARNRSSGEWDPPTRSRRSVPPTPSDPQLALVRDTLEPGIRQFIPRQSSAANPAMASSKIRNQRVSGVHGTVPGQTCSLIRFQIADGISLDLRADVAARLASSDKRRELLARIEAMLDDRLGDD